MVTGRATETKSAPTLPARASPYNSAMTEPWYVTAFAAEYLQLYRHRSPAQGRQQVQQMLASGLLPKQGPVLDLCCGAGRHLLPMRESGLQAYGLDLSLPLLRAGKLGGVSVRGNALRLPFASGAFRCVTNLFSSFGYFPDDAAHALVLREIARVLGPAGTLVLDHMNAAVTIACLKPETREEIDGVQMFQRRKYDAENRRVLKDVEYTVPGQQPRRWHESVRLFTPAELDKFMRDAGLSVSARYADLDASPFDEANSPRQVVVANKA